MASGYKKLSGYKRLEAVFGEVRGVRGKGISAFGHGYSNRRIPNKGEPPLTQAEIEANRLVRELQAQEPKIPKFCCPGPVEGVLYIDLKDFCREFKKLATLSGHGKLDALIIRDAQISQEGNLIPNVFVFSNDGLENAQKLDLEAPIFRSQKRDRLLSFDLDSDSFDQNASGENLRRQIRGLVFDASDSATLALSWKEDVYGKIGYFKVFNPDQPFVLPDNAGAITPLQGEGTNIFLGEFDAASKISEKMLGLSGHLGAVFLATDEGERLARIRPPVTNRSRPYVMSVPSFVEAWNASNGRGVGRPLQDFKRPFSGYCTVYERVKQWNPGTERFEEVGCDDLIQPDAHIYGIEEPILTFKIL